MKIDMHLKKKQKNCMLKIIQVLTLTNSLTVQAKIFKQFYSHKTMHKNQMRKLP